MRINKTYQNSKSNYLLRYFIKNKKRGINKWLHYFDIYEHYFSRYRNKPTHVLEIGVAEGGSLQMWKSYFGKRAHVTGVDIDPKCKSLEGKGIKVFIGDQADRTFLRELKQKIPKQDIIIDDGGHMMDQQITSFEELYQHVKEGGVYLCEDVHTSYHPDYKGGYKKKDTFVEYCKNLVDKLNAYHSFSSALTPDNFTNSIYSITFYDSIVAITMSRRLHPPTDMMTGKIPIKRRIITSLTKTKKKYFKKLD